MRAHILTIGQGGENLVKFANIVSQGTMMTIEWSQENSVLPTCNFSEGIFEDAEAIGGFSMEKIKSSRARVRLDTISLGNVIGFAMEASKKGLIKEKIPWGDNKAASSNRGYCIQAWNR